MSRLHFGLRYLLVSVTSCALQMASVQYFGPRALVGLPFLGAVLFARMWRDSGRRRPLLSAIQAGCGGAAGLVLADVLARNFWPGWGLSVPITSWNVLSAYALFGGASFIMFAVATMVLAGSSTRMCVDEQKVVLLAIGWTLVVVWMISLARFVWDPYLYTNNAPDDTINIAAWYFLSLIVGSIIAILPAAIVVAIAMIVYWWRFERKSGVVKFDE